MLKNMGNMQQMMKQAQKLQKQMVEAQENLTKQEFVGKSTQDYVVATFSGDKILRNLEIKSEVVDPEDVELVSDMIVMAVNDGLGQIDKAQEASMGKYTKGLPF